jgi:hypothetical protein
MSKVPNPWKKGKRGGLMMLKNQENGVMSGRIVTLAALFLMIFLFCFCTSRPVFGGEPRPCAEDLANFCKDVRPGGGRIISCLKEHESELTPVCKDKLEEVRKRLEKAKRICSNDIEKFCKGVKEGEGRIARCLGTHVTELSPACAEQVEWVKAKTKAK